MPSGWTTSNTGTGITERWSMSNTANAGGTAYEAKCTYQQVSPGTTMLISPAFTTSGVSSITIGAKYQFDDYGTGATLKVQVSKDKITWVDAWTKASASNTTTSGTISAVFTNTAVLGTANTYIAFVVTGNLYQIDYWYVDNVTVTGATTPVVVVPTVTTNTVSSIAQTTATCGGNVTADGGATVSAKGVCWATTTNPTTANSKTTNGTGTGAFTSSLTGLTANTTYYVRAYATNSAGTSYGAVQTFKTLATSTGPVCTTTANISVAASAWKYYTVVVPTGATNLVIGISGGTGDADLYTRFGSKPTTTTYLCRPYLSGNTETCTVASPSVGTYYIGIRGYSAATGITLSVCYTPAAKSDGFEIQYVGSDVDDGNTFDIYPNPAYDFIYITVGGQTQNAVIYDVNGRIVKSIDLNGERQINIEELPAGIYMLHVFDEGKMLSKRFIKK
jgi:hypothetical protein